MNKVLGRKGTLWQKEYWDRIVRNEHHFQKCVEYIFENPGKLEIPVFLRFDAFPGECAGKCEAAGVRFSQDEAASRRVSCSIGVCGLNPHAGEQGILGREEIEIIEPVLEKLRSRFPGLSHCVPADTIFARQLRGEFDVVVALYHDQALAPLKTVEFDEAVNISLGLPFIRTSPDHGTAYDIAGKGIAQIRSFANAVKMARILSS
ncbi:MAG: 4-hydroxythreonine-4-phosphate dehydrogenase PdxA [Opitutales bacterium]|nr:4-hydroxythreonine-4-phosphate dehydrogenase PdxA [Opitutales bacterium]